MNEALEGYLAKLGLKEPEIVGFETAVKQIAAAAYSNDADTASGLRRQFVAAANLGIIPSELNIIVLQLGLAGQHDPYKLEK